MKGNAKIVSALNELLAYELAAMDQYFIHSQMYLDWGLNKLYERIDHEFDDEENDPDFEDGRSDDSFSPDQTWKNMQTSTPGFCKKIWSL